jgi:hypothetical protein
MMRFVPQRILRELISCVTITIPIKLLWCGVPLILVHGVRLVYFKNTEDKI